jgi:uncharacterized protein YggE
MCRLLSSLAILLLLICQSSSAALGQFGGSRAGIDSNSAMMGNSAVGNLPTLSREVAEGFITIDGRAEIRVRPTEIRIVLAVTGEGETAQDCQQTIEATMNKLKQSWTDLGIPAENIVEDFIAVLPLYTWSLEKRDDVDVGIEKLTSFRMQTNVHLSVPNDANAAKAFTVAFEHGVTDIIAFDYWSRELDDFKIKAREQAVKAARGKSDILFAALFDDRPPVINVQEQTTVRYPESLYDSFVNTYQEEVTVPWRREIPFIRAYRPRNTYYRGLYTDGDIQPSDLPMHPEISVISTVRLYFESPAAQRSSQRKDQDNDKD